MDKINLTQKFGLIHEYWQPKIVGELNEFVRQTGKTQGGFCLA